MTCLHEKTHCPLCAGLDVYAPALYKEDEINRWGAVHWWTEAGYWYEKYIESERENKNLREMQG